MVQTSDYTAAIFFLVVSAIWFGTSNAAREIVSERAIYMRERMVNLGLLNYVFSKFILLAVFCIVQCTVLLAIVFFGLQLPGGLPVFGQMLGALVMTWPPRSGSCSRRWSPRARPPWPSPRSR
jgi:hypothetical protein